MPAGPEPLLRVRRQHVVAQTLQRSADPAAKIALYHATEVANLRSIAHHGLLANRGGTGGFTDAVSEIEKTREHIAADRKAVSAGRVHLGGSSLANLYYSGVKLGMGLDKFLSEKLAHHEALIEVAMPGVAQWKRAPFVKASMDADAEVIAARRKIDAERAVLMIEETVAGASKFDADPHEDQLLESGHANFAVRSESDIPPNRLSILTTVGTMPLTDFVDSAGLPFYAVKPVAPPHATKEVISGYKAFYEGVNKSAWNLEDARKKAAAAAPPTAAAAGPQNAH